jgi:hypothetical protein
VLKECSIVFDPSKFESMVGLMSYATMCRDDITVLRLGQALEVEALPISNTQSLVSMVNMLLSSPYILLSSMLCITCSYQC